MRREQNDGEGAGADERYEDTRSNHDWSPGQLVFRTNFVGISLNRVSAAQFPSAHEAFRFASLCRLLVTNHRGALDGGSNAADSALIQSLKALTAGIAAARGG